jgi:hypothetical protein
MYAGPAMNGFLIPQSFFGRDIMIPLMGALLSMLYRYPVPKGGRYRTESGATEVREWWRSRCMFFRYTQINAQASNSSSSSSQSANGTRQVTIIQSPSHCLCLMSSIDIPTLVQAKKLTMAAARRKMSAWMKLGKK